MNKKVNRLVKGLGFFSIVVGLLFVGLVYALKKDLMIAEIGKLFNYGIDFMFHREWVGRVLTANLIIIVSVITSLIWFITNFRKKRYAAGFFGSMGVLGFSASLLMMYRYRKSLLGNIKYHPAMGKAILIVLVFFLLLMALNVIAAFLSVGLDKEDEKSDCKVANKLGKTSKVIFAIFATLTAIACVMALAFKFEGVMKRAPKFYHFVLDLINIDKWDASNIARNFSAFLVVLTAGLWMIYNMTKKRNSVGPLLLVVLTGMTVAWINYKPTFAFYAEHGTVYLNIVLYVFYGLFGLAALAALLALIADSLATSVRKRKIDLITIQVNGGIKNLVHEEVVEEKPVEVKPVIEEPAVEVEPVAEVEPAVEEPVVEEEIVEENEETVDLGEDFIEVIDENNKKLIINKRLYTNKLCLAESDLKNNYNIIKNAILKYAKVRSRISANYESFRKGRKLLVRFNILGKTLRVYLALDPNEYPVTVYHQRDEESKRKYELVPMMLRVRSPRSVRNAVKLIDELMEKEGIALAKNYKEVDYAKEFKYDSNALLIKDGFKKLVREEIDEAHADELSDDEALRVVVTKEVEEEVVSQQKQVASNKKNNKAIVNVDQINQIFDYNEYVTIEKLKEKGLVNKKTNYVKVLSRGVINKPMTIEANEFSLKAVKMIVLTGGSVVRLVSHK